MLQNQLAQGNPANGWKAYNEIDVDGVKFERALPHSIAAVFLTPGHRWGFWSGTVDKLVGQGVPLVCFSLRKYRSPFHAGEC